MFITSTSNGVVTEQVVQTESQAWNNLLSAFRHTIANTAASIIATNTSTDYGRYKADSNNNGSNVTTATRSEQQPQFVPPLLIDAHCHLHLPPLKTLQHSLACIALAQTYNIQRFVVCATSPSNDWTRVEEMFCSFHRSAGCMTNATASDNCRIGNSKANSDVTTTDCFVDMKAAAVDAVTDKVDSTENPVIPCFGLHPWWIREYLDDVIASASRCTTITTTTATATDSNSNNISNLYELHLDAATKQLRQQLDAVLTRHLAAQVGECGLDKTIKKTVTVDTQLELLLVQYRAAEHHQRSLTIHCVGYWGRLLEFLQQQELSGRKRHKHDAMDNTKSTTTTTATTKNTSASSIPAIILHSCNTLPVSLLPAFLKLPNVFFSFSAKLLVQNNYESASVHDEVDVDDRVSVEDSTSGGAIKVGASDVDTNNNTNNVKRNNNKTNKHNNDEKVHIPSTNIIQTSNNNHNQLVKQVPLNRLLLESDSPDQLPNNFQGVVSYNQPLIVRLSCDVVAALRNTSSAEIAEITTHNAIRAFQMLY